jgi:hypothetical protein
VAFKTINSFFLSLASKTFKTSSLNSQQHQQQEQQEKHFYKIKKCLLPF